VVILSVVAQTTALMEELRRLARRGIDRAFHPVGNKPPLELPILFEIVDTVCQDLWAGDEGQKIEAIKETLRRAAKELSSVRLETPNPVTVRHAVLRLYGLLSVPDELRQKHARNESLYIPLVHVLAEETRWPGRSDFREPHRVRRELAKALESLAAPPTAPASPETPSLHPTHENSQADTASAPVSSNDQATEHPVENQLGTPTVAPSPIEKAEEPKDYTDHLVDDHALALAMHPRIDRIEFLVEYWRRTGRDARKARAELEAKFGLKVGKKAMRIAAAEARWASPTAYTDFDLTSREGVRNMYRQMMEEAAWAIYSKDMSDVDIVAAMKRNTYRVDISGRDDAGMAVQIRLSAERLRAILRGKPTVIQGRVVDEMGNVVEGLQQLAGSSIRLNRQGAVIAASPNLISDSEVDYWMRGVLENAGIHRIASSTCDSLMVLAPYIRTRLDRSVAWQRQLERQSVEESDRVEVRDALVQAERETKRQLAVIDALREALEQTNSTNMHIFAERVLIHDIDWAAAGWINIAMVIDLLRGDREFQHHRRKVAA